MANKKSSKKNLILVHVSVDRKKDAMVEPGTTVEQLIDALKADGYDVKDADISIVTSSKDAEKNPMKHELSYGDIVSFDTESVDLANTDAEAEAVLASACAEEEEDDDEVEEEEENEDAVESCDPDGCTGYDEYDDCDGCERADHCPCSGMADDQDILVSMFRNIMSKRNMKAGSICIRIDKSGNVSYSVDQLG